MRTTDFLSEPGRVYWLDADGVHLPVKVESLGGGALRFHHDTTGELQSEPVGGALTDLPGGWDHEAPYPVITSHMHKHADLYAIAHKAASGEIGGYDGDDIIFVDKGQTAKISSPVRCHALAVAGTLEITADLDVETIVVYPSGHLIVTAGTISFQGTIAHDPSQSAVGIFNSGQVTIDGGPKQRLCEVRKSASETAFVGQIPASWQVGDEVAFPDMQRVRLSIYQQRTHRILKSQIETRRIIGIEGQVLVLDAPLEYDHTDTKTGLIPCGNLTSKVTLETEPLSPSRAHAFFSCHHAPIRVKGATFKNMGRTTADAITPAGGSNQIGRYPCHAHHCDDFVFEDSVVWDSPRHGFVHHNSNGDIKGCLVVDAMASGIFAEEGGELGAWVDNTVFSACYASHLMNDDQQFGSHEGRELGSGGFAFWMRTHNVVLEGNRAYGFVLAGYASFTHGSFSKQTIYNLPFIFRDNHFHGSAESVLRIQYNTRPNTIERLKAWNRMDNGDGLTAIHSGAFNFLGGTLGADNGRVTALNLNGKATSELSIGDLVLEGEWKSLSYRFTLV